MQLDLNDAISRITAMYESDIATPQAATSSPLPRLLGKCTELKRYYADAYGATRNAFEMVQLAPLADAPDDPSSMTDEIREELLGRIDDIRQGVVVAFKGAQAQAERAANAHMPGCLPADESVPERATVASIVAAFEAVFGLAIGAALVASAAGQAGLGEMLCRASMAIGMALGIYYSL